MAKAEQELAARLLQAGKPRYKIKERLLLMNSNENVVNIAITRAAKELHGDKKKRRN